MTGKSLADTREIVRNALQQKLGQLELRKKQFEAEANNRRHDAETHRKYAVQNDDLAEIAESKAREAQEEIEDFREELNNQFRYSAESSTNGKRVDQVESVDPGTLRTPD